jgi:hypothetical protein
MSDTKPALCPTCYEPVEWRPVPEGYQAYNPSGSLHVCGGEKE